MLILLLLLQRQVHHYHLVDLKFNSGSPTCDVLCSDGQLRAVARIGDTLTCGCTIMGGGTLTGGGSGG